MSEDEFWQRLAKVAMGLRGDDPVNWPHYADEARRLMDENARLRERVAELQDAECRGRGA